MNVAARSFPFQREGRIFQIDLTFVNQVDPVAQEQHPSISAFITSFEAPQSFNDKVLEHFSMQLFFLPRKTCSPYSLLDSRLLQRFVKEGTSEKDQLQGDSILQDTEQKSKPFKQNGPVW